MITWNDIERLVTETGAGDEEEQTKRIERWQAENNFEENIFDKITATVAPLVLAGLIHSMERAETPIDAFAASVEAIALLYFTMGFEVHKQYGEVGTNPGIDTA